MDILFGLVFAVVLLMILSTFVGIGLVGFRAQRFMSHVFNAAQRRMEVESDTPERKPVCCEYCNFKVFDSSACPKCGAPLP